MGVMAVDDAASGNLASAFPRNNTDIESSVLSQEDLAWVDSCLSKDVEALESGWDSLMDALMENAEIRHYPSDPEYSNPPGSQKSVNLHSDEGVSSSTINSYDSIRIGDQLNAELVDESWLGDKTNDIFLPTHKGEAEDIGSNDPDIKLSMEPSQQSDSLFDDIFKVWDLDIPQEQEPLVEQLTKALDGSSSYPSTRKDSDPPNDLSLDDLVSSMADLSLNRKNNKS